jgi:hypothetical protein
MATAQQQKIKSAGGQKPIVLGLVAVFLTLWVANSFDHVATGV